MGYRYRLHDRRLPGSPDIVFAGKRKVIFVHGCFWHQHPDPGCLDNHVPKSNEAYWGPKLERTQDRDAANQQSLRSLGWKWLILWECELGDTASLQPRIKDFLG